MTRVAVVTGGAKGIGLATCQLLQEQGWDVIPLDRQPMDQSQALHVDLGDASATTAALSALSRVDALVNNAALQLNKPLVDTAIDEWDAIVAVNVRAALVCIKALHRQLAEAKGSVVNITSVHALATSSSVAAYAASKGALSAFTRASAIELAPLGVRVNAVVPGAVDTDALREGFSRRANTMGRLIDQTPLKRFGSPRDVAQAVAFLVDHDRSGFITGQEFIVDGGALARLSTE